MHVFVKNLKWAYQAGKFFGFKWWGQRVMYALKLRTGWFAHILPSHDWKSFCLESCLSDPSLGHPQTYLAYRRSGSIRFFFDPDSYRHETVSFQEWDANESPTLAIKRMVQGDYTYFSSSVATAGFPPRWHFNPFTGQETPTDTHWSNLGDFDCGDIKVIWEPNRWSFAYTLVRAYWRTGDEQYPESFWQILEDWRDHNEPQQGTNWKCGQEVSLRVMAWCFGLYGFLHCTATTAERVSMLVQMIAISGNRIYCNIEYALRQQNNHGISEGAGLLTIGMLFPELRDAKRWRESGRRILEDEGRKLIYEDGAFSQHSAVYQRFMLHTYLWVLRLADLHEQPFSDVLKQNVAKAGAFLYQIQDVQSGYVPNFGHNDGSLILPLTNCDFRDFRPVIQAIYYFSTGNRCYDHGLWDEELFWLFGVESLDAPLVKVAQKDLKADVGGFYTLRNSTGFVFARCTRAFRHRPSQADMLHIDLWWKGLNIALDAGTYSYNAPPPWDNCLGQTAYHNTVTVDGCDQMDQVNRFLWLPWVQGRVLHLQYSANGQLAYWEAEHHGYRRLTEPVSHRRAILRLDEEHWLVLDALRSRGPHSYRLHWLLPDMKYDWDEASGKVRLETPVGSYFLQTASLTGENIYSVVRADDLTPRGWQAPYYLHREAALSFSAIQNAMSVCFWTLLGSQPCHVTTVGTTLSIEADSWQADVQCGAQVQEALMSSIRLSGSVEDYIQVCF